MPISMIFVVIIIAIVGVVQAVDNFFSLNTLKDMMEGIIDGAPSMIALMIVLVCIKISYDNLEEKEGWGSLTTVYKVLLWIFIPISFAFYYELYALDVNKNCFGLLGKYVPSYILAVLVTYIIITGLFVVINYARDSLITLICCVLQVVAIISVYLISANVCGDSYGLGAAKESAGEESIQYVVTQPVKARYPSYIYLISPKANGENSVPTFLPLKLVAANLKEGDIVYSSEDNVNGGKILVSDGERSGYVDASCLKKCEKQFRYTFVVNNREKKAPLYEKATWSTQFCQPSIDSKIIQYLEPGELVRKIGTDGGVNHQLDYIKVEIESGVQGYLPSRYVNIIKTPVDS